MNKLLGVFLLAALILMIGCAAQVETKKASAPIKEGEDSGKTADISMTAKRFEFTPSTIKVNRGDAVRITITSKDATHGFSLPDFGVNEKIGPDKPAVVEFVADKTGEFTFRCNIPCGSGHGGMKGTLIVE